MGQIDRLRAGMAVTDIESHLVGTVRSVGTDTFIVKTEDGDLELGADALFAVGEFVAALICPSSGIGAYCV